MLFAFLFFAHYLFSKIQNLCLLLLFLGLFWKQISEFLISNSSRSSIVFLHRMNESSKDPRVKMMTDLATTVHSRATILFYLTIRKWHNTNIILWWY